MTRVGASSEAASPRVPPTSAGITVLKMALLITVLNTPPATATGASTTKRSGMLGTKAQPVMPAAMMMTDASSNTCSEKRAVRGRMSTPWVMTESSPTYARM